MSSIESLDQLILFGPTPKTAKTMDDGSVAGLALKNSNDTLLTVTGNRTDSKFYGVSYT